MTNLTDAIVLATQAHAGQLDKSGDLYIHHPLRVMERVRQALLPEGIDRSLAMQVAVLHDTIEDTEIGLMDLIERDYPAAVVKGVMAMTKRDNEPYEDFVRRAIVDPYARVVKWHDIEDNSDPVRLFKLDPATRDRLIEKYRRGKAVFDA